jgi:hypothetical protein
VALRVTVKTALRILGIGNPSRPIRSSSSGSGFPTTLTQTETESGCDSANRAAASKSSSDVRPGSGATQLPSGSGHGEANGSPPGSDSLSSYGPTSVTVKRSPS